MIPQVAFIDSDIDIDYISRLLCEKQTLREVLTISGMKVIASIRSPSKTLSHGSLCARTFLMHFNGECDLYFFNIWGTEETKANIDALLTALSWCLENGIQLINMSLGTTRLLDVSKLNPLIERLAAKNTIMVAASSNQRQLTFPAAFKHVLGVKAIPYRKGQPTGFIYEEDRLDRVQVSCYIPDETVDYQEKFYSVYNANSTAAPIISAKACTMLSAGCRSLHEVEEKLKGESLKKVPKYLKKLYADYVKAEIDKPVIAILHDEVATYSVQLESSFAERGYQGICLTEKSETDFSRKIINMMDCKGFRPAEKVRFYAHYCNADYILFEVSERFFGQYFKFFDFDIVLHRVGFVPQRFRKDIIRITFLEPIEVSEKFDEVFRYLSSN